MIRVDSNHNEDWLFEELKAVHANTERSPMDVGDVHIETEHAFLIVERKSVEDLCASIQDERFAQQRSRWVQFDQDTIDKPVRFAVLVHGQTPLYNGMPVHHRTRINGKAVLNSLARTSIVYGVAVLWVRAQSDVAPQLVRLLEDLKTERCLEPRLVPQFHGAGKRKRDLQTDPTEVLRAQLSVVLGMSDNKAKGVLARFPSWSMLCAATEKELAEVSCGKQKLGPVIAKRLKQLC